MREKKKKKHGHLKRGREKNDTRLQNKRTHGRGDEGRRKGERRKRRRRQKKKKKRREIKVEGLPNQDCIGNPIKKWKTS